MRSTRQTTPPPAAHECAPPMAERIWQLPPPPLGGEGLPGSTHVHRETLPAGKFGDLWRCDTCATLWRIGDSCSDCDRYNLKGDHGNLMHVLSTMWRPAKWWQRLWFRRPGDRD